MPEHTDAEAADQTSNDEHRIPCRRGLKCGADNKDAHGDDNRMLPRDLVGDPTLTESTYGMPVHNRVRVTHDWYCKYPV